KWTSAMADAGVIRGGPEAVLMASYRLAAVRAIGDLLNRSWDAALKELDAAVKSLEELIEVSLRRDGLLERLSLPQMITAIRDRDTLCIARIRLKEHIQRGSESFLDPTVMLFGFEGIAAWLPPECSDNAADAFDKWYDKALTELDRIRRTEQA